MWAVPSSVPDIRSLRIFSKCRVGPPPKRAGGSQLPQLLAPVASYKFSKAPWVAEDENCSVTKKFQRPPASPLALPTVTLLPGNTAANPLAVQSAAFGSALPPV